MHFDQLGLSEEILKALNEQGYKTPTAIQLKAIPVILDNQDVMAAAQTGTGKTAGFTLPILDRLSHGEAVKPGCIRTLILTPTRELAAQVADSINTYGKFLSVTSSVVFGGVKIAPQMARLRKGVDILVATPGRLLDLYQQKAVNFSQLEVLVLDEADRMLDMGFIHDIKKIISALPKKRQNLMFSATFSTEIRTLAKGLMNKPVEISVTPANTTVNAIKQWIHPVDKKNKNKLLSHLIWEGKWEQVLVFARTKHGANRLAEFLIEDGMQAVAIHGNKSQGSRTRALADFKAGEVRVLVATDIAARGLDIELLPHVVNFDLPQVPEDYIHRIGRTGRAGATGEAISLVSADEFRLLAEIERLIKQNLERIEVDGFTPMHSLPERAVDATPRRATRSNQPKRNDDRYASRGRRDDRSEKSDRPARFDRADMPRIQKAERFERMSKKEWPPKKNDRFAKSSDRSERPARFDRPEKKEWAPRTERSAAPSRNREDRPARFDRTEKKEWTPRADRPVRSNSTRRDDRPVRSDRSERPARFDHAEKKEWSPRGDRPVRREAPNRDDRSPRSDRPERPARFDRNDRSAAAPRRDREDRSARFDRTEKKEWSPRGERSAAPRRDREERPARSDRSERPARFDRPEKKEWTSRAERSEKRSFSSDRPARSGSSNRDDRFSKLDRPARSSEGRSERAPRAAGGAGRPSGRPSGARPSGRSTTGPRRPSRP